VLPSLGACPVGTPTESPKIRRRFLAPAFLWGFAFSVTWLYLNFLFESLGFSNSLVGTANAIPNMVAIVFASGFLVLFAAMLLHAAGITYSWLILRPLEEAAGDPLDRTDPPAL